MKFNHSIKLIFATACYSTLITSQIIAQGFAPTATNWATPVGGQYNSSGASFGYLEMYGSSWNYNNCQNWSVADMNGDGMQDLVVSGQHTGGSNIQFGVGTAPYWKVYLNNGAGYAPTATNWATPIGGQYNSSGTNFGYLTMYGSSWNYNNCQNWSVSDMNSDGMPDLVVTGQHTGGSNIQFGVGTSPYWKVYLNTGAGFSATATNWSTPVGGQYNSSGTNFGYLEMYGSSWSYNNCQNWSVADINGDGMQDLVVTGQHTGGSNIQFGVGASPYWKVYLNTGTGFSGSATNWATPAGGQYNSSGINFGLLTMYGSSWNYNNCQSWSVSDMNSDGMPDLVVTSQYTGGSNLQFGVGASPYWKVYLNNGTGYAPTATNWATPVGGQYNSSGTNFGYVEMYGSSWSNNNCQSWSMADMNNDGITDLVVTCQHTGGSNLQFGVGASPYWKVYLNNGTGYAPTAINWATPVGGQYNSSGTNFGYLEMYGSSWSNNNCQNWSVSDMNGDGMPDLVVTGQHIGGSNIQFGVGASPYWKVYLNTGITGLNTVKHTLGISVFPNPCVGKFVVTGSHIVPSNYIITDLAGEKLQEGKLNFGRNEIILDKAKGIYLLTISTLNKTWSEKIVVQ